MVTVGRPAPIERYHALTARALVALLLAIAAAPRAEAQCVQTNPMTFECNGQDPDGFTASDDDILVNVNPAASVQNGGAAAAIAVLKDSQVNVFGTSSVTADGAGNVGVSAGAGSVVVGRGVIQSNGPNGVGISLSNGGVLLTDRTAAVISGGPGGFAIRGDSGSSIVEHGVGEIQGNVNLGAGDDQFVLHVGAITTGTIDGGGGNDEFTLVDSWNANPNAATLDLSTAVNFERLEVFGDAASPDTWTLQGTGGFTDGTTVNSGHVTFAPGASIGGAFTLVDGLLEVDTATTFGGGLSVAGGTAVFGSGADVAGAVAIDGGVAAIGVATFQNGLTSNSGRTILIDNASLQGDVVANGGVVSIDGAPAMQGDLALGSGSTFETEIASGGTSSRLGVTGDVTIDGAQLAVRRSGGGNFDMAQGFVVLTTTNSITGTFSDVRGVGPGTGFVSLQAAYDPNAIRLIAQTTFTAPARSDNQYAVGLHLDSAASNGPSPELQAYLDSLEMLAPNGAVRALEGLSPEVYDAHTSASLATADAFAGMLAGRPIRCERVIAPNVGSAPSLAPCSRDGFTGWADAFGRYAERDASPGYKDWSYGGGGFAIGADRDFGGAFTASALLGASRLSIDYDGDGDGSLTTIELGAAVGWLHGGTHVRGVALYGHGWNDTRRQIGYPGFSELDVGDFDSDGVTLLVEGSHEFLLGPVELEPLASIEYTYLHEDSSSESRENITALNVDSRSTDYVAAEGGFRVGGTIVKHGYLTDFLEWADGVWRPELDARWRQVLNDYDRSITASLRAAPPMTGDFHTKTRDAQYGGVIRAAVSFQPQGSRNTIHLGYDAFVGNRTLVHTVMAKVRVPF